MPGAAPCCRNLTAIAHADVRSGTKGPCPTTGRRSMGMCGQGDRHPVVHALHWWRDSKPANPCSWFCLLKHALGRTTIPLLFAVNFCASLCMTGHDVMTCTSIEHAAGAAL